MIVEDNYAITIATLSDWFKNITPVSQPTRRKTNQSSYMRLFPRFEQVASHCKESF